MLWGEKPYFSLDYYLKQTFGSKTYKASLDAGFTCPNRDGTIGRGGCIFCSRGGSGEFAGSRALSIKEQIDSQIEKLGSFHAKQYIAYYQAFTNTYADLDYLRRVYEPSFYMKRLRWWILRQDQTVWERMLFHFFVNIPKESRCG